MSLLAAQSLARLCHGLEPPPLTACLGAQLHPALAPALARMAQAARAAGFELAIASGYRDFERQRQIFNAKAGGLRPLLDGQGRPLDAAALAPGERLHAILRWSALPGASRHHWGSDLDVYDQRPCAGGYALQLTAEECATGAMAPFHLWLGDYLSTAHAEFTRPYALDRGGVAPEPWHLSYAPLAAECEAAFDVARLRQALEGAELALKGEILANLEALVRRYVRVW